MVREVQSSVVNSSVTQPRITDGYKIELINAKDATKGLGH